MDVIDLPGFETWKVWAWRLKTYAKVNKTYPAAGSHFIFETVIVHVRFLLQQTSAP